MKTCAQCGRSENEVVLVKRSETPGDYGYQYVCRDYKECLDYLIKERKV